MLTIIAMLIFPITGALVYRWRGMEHHPHPLPQLLFALPYALPCGWWAIAVYPVTFLTTLLGHGPYFLPPSIKYINDGFPPVDFLLRPFFGKDPRETGTDAIAAYGDRRLYWRCFAGMALTGLAITIPCGIATFNPYIAFSGVLKAVAYAVTTEEKAELLTGFLLCGALYLLY